MAPNTKRISKKTSNDLDPRENAWMEYIFLGAVCLIIIFVRIRLLSFPLERDEGEYAYMGKLILSGIAPYTEAYNMKLPGTAFMYALNMLLFGKTTIGVHLGLLWANLLTVFFYYLFVKKLLGGSCAVIAATAYALLSTGSGVFGFAAHATHFVNLFGIAGLYVTSIAFEKKKYSYCFAAGVLLGIAPIMKQSGIVFPLAGLLLLITFCLKNSAPTQKIPHTANIFSLTAGYILPFSLFIIYMYLNGAWDKFIFWTITYARDYANQIPLSLAYDSFLENFTTVSNKDLLIWIMAIPGLFAGFAVKRLRCVAVFILLFALLSLIGICPGFYFRPHYFVQFLPALGLMLASAIFVIDFFISKKIDTTTCGLFKWGLLFVLAFYCLNADKDYFFIESPARLSKTYYRGNPFADSMQIAEFIKGNTNESDRIAIFGSEPQILFYADRKSATGYIYTYNLMEIHKNSLLMQKEMAAEIEKNHPPVLIFINIYTSWLPRKESEKYIFEWFDKYILDNNFKIIGFIDIHEKTSAFILGNNAKNHRPQTLSYITIWKKESL